MPKIAEVTKAKRVPNLYNEVYTGEGVIPPTQYSKHALVIRNAGDKPVGVETSSERGDTNMEVPVGCEMVLDARAERFFTSGPAHISLEKLTQKDIAELDRLEKENQDEEFAKHGFRRPGHPAYIREAE